MRVETRQIRMREDYPVTPDLHEAVIHIIDMYVDQLYGYAQPEVAMEFKLMYGYAVVTIRPAFYWDSNTDQRALLWRISIVEFEDRAHCVMTKQDDLWRGEHVQVRNAIRKDIAEHAANSVPEQYGDW